MATAATMMVKTLLVKNPKMTNADLQAALTKSGHQLSELATVVARAEFLRTVRFLQNRGLLKKKLVD